MNFRKKVRGFWNNFITILKRPEMAILPGQLAFFFVLSVVPIITLIGYGATFFKVPMTLIGNFLETVFSKDVVNLIVPTIGSTEFSFSFIVLIIIGFYIASNGAKSIILTSNTIYGIENKKKINIRIKAIIMTIIIVLLFLFILIVPLFGDKIIELIKYIQIDTKVVKSIEVIFYFLKGPFSWLFMFIGIKIIYTMAPDKKIPSSSVNVGALFATICWILTTAIYSYYVNHFARYDLLFAGLSNIVILMLWVYLLATIFVYGLALNYRENEKLEKTGIIVTKKK